MMAVCGQNEPSFGGLDILSFCRPCQYSHEVILVTSLTLLPAHTHSDSHVFFNFPISNLNPTLSLFTHAEISMYFLSSM